MQPGHFRQIHSSLYIPISIRSIAPPFFDWLLQPGSYSRVFLALTARLLQPFFGSYSQALTALFFGSYSQALTAFFWLLQPGSYSPFFGSYSQALTAFFRFFWLLQPGSYSQALTAVFFGSYSQPLTGFCIAVPAVPDIHPVRLRNASKPPLKLDYLS